MAVKPAGSPYCAAHVQEAGAVLLTAWRHLPASAFRVLASLLELGPPGHPVRLTDDEIGIRCGYVKGAAKRPIRFLQSQTIPGTAVPWVGSPRRPGPGRILRVNAIPPHAVLDGEPHVARRGRARKGKEGGES